MNEEGTEKRSVSAPQQLFEKADDRMASLMITNFSEYVRTLIRADLEGKLKVPAAAAKVEEPKEAA